MVPICGSALKPGSEEDTLDYVQGDTENNNLFPENVKFKTEKLYMLEKTQYFLTTPPTQGHHRLDAFKHKKELKH